MAKTKANAQKLGGAELPLKPPHVEEIEDLVKKLTGARQALTFSFALWLAWQKSEEPFNSDTRNQVTALLSECLEMVSHLTNTLDQLRMLTYGSKDSAKTMSSTEQAPQGLRQLKLWDVD